MSIIAGSAAIALGVSDAINRRFLAPGGMHVTTDVVGYPTLRNFDSVHYTELFALAAVVFPVILLVSFVVLDRIVPRVFARFGNERVVNGAGVAGRLAIPGAALGLAVAAAAQQTGRAAVVATMVLGAVAWAVVVGAAAFVLDRLRPGESYAFRLAEANALAVPATLLGLAAVSTATGVEVVDTDTVEHHPFLPWWLAVVGVAVVVGLVAWRLRSAGPGIEDRRAFERDTVALVAGSVIVFLITAKLPGAVGPMDAFHEGEWNPDVNVVTHDVRLGADNVMDILSGYDIVVDGADNFPVRYLLNDAALKLGIPVVHGSIFRFEGQITVFKPHDGPCYRCFLPEPPPPELAPSCAEAGVLGRAAMHRRLDPGRRGHQAHARPRRRPVGAPPGLRLAGAVVPHLQDAARPAVPDVLDRSRPDRDRRVRRAVRPAPPAGAAGLAASAAQRGAVSGSGLAVAASARSSRSRSSATSDASAPVRDSSRDSSHEKWIVRTRRNPTAASRNAAGG